MIFRKIIFVALVATCFSQLAHGRDAAVITLPSTAPCSTEKINCAATGSCIDSAGNNICPCQAEANSEICLPEAKQKQTKDA